MLDSKIIEMYQRSGIPQVYWESHIKNIPDKAYKEQVIEWINGLKANRFNHLESSKGMYIHGPYGSGKSAIAAMLLRAGVGVGIFGLWVNYRQIAGFKIDKNEFDEHETYYERMLSVPLLVIDEVEFKINKGFLVETLEDLVRNRTQKRRPTVVTSNHSTKYLSEIGQSNDKNDMVIYSQISGFLGVFPEAFQPMYVYGRNFRTNPVSN